MFKNFKLSPIAKVANLGISNQRPARPLLIYCQFLTQRLVLLIRRPGGFRGVDAFQKRGIPRAPMRRHPSFPPLCACVHYFFLRNRGQVEIARRATFSSGRGHVSRGTFVASSISLACLCSAASMLDRRVFNTASSPFVRNRDYGKVG